MLPSDIVASDPEILGGSAAFRGTRVHARTLFDYLAAGHTIDEFLADFPAVRREQAVGLLDTVREEVVAAAESREMAGA